MASKYFLEQISRRLPLSKVVGEHVALHKQGNEWTGQSPFAKATTNTLFVMDEKGLFYDFATGKQGDAIAFVMEVEGLSSDAAVDRLARMAGLPMPAS